MAQTHVGLIWNNTCAHSPCLSCLLDIGFRKQSDHRWVYLHQLFSGDNFKTFKQLKNDCDLPRTDFFLTTHKEWGKLMKDTPIETFLIEIQTGNHNKKTISKFLYFYSVFLSVNLHNSLHIKQSWEAETNMVISQDSWKEVCTCYKLKHMVGI